MSSKRVVIVGGGYGAACLVRALWQRGGMTDLKVDVLEREQTGGFERFDLPRVLRGEASAAEIARYDASWFEQRGVTYHKGARVHLVDRMRRRVQADQLTLPFDKLVLATGSVAYLPAIKGLLRPDGGLHAGAYSLRTLADAETIVAASSTARHAVVLGGGRSGIEISEALSLRGLDVTLVQLPTRLMSGHIDDVASDILRARIERLGCKVLMGVRATAVLGGSSLKGVLLQDGTELPCDLLVLATGVQPETWLAYQCGLTVERGVVVEGRMRSVDDLDIHALGECAQWRGSIHALPDQISDQAEVIAEHLTTQHSSRRYLPFQRGSLYHVLGMSLSTVGSPTPKSGDDAIQLRESSRARYKQIVLRKGRVAGAILMGDTRYADQLTRLYTSCELLPAATRARLFELELPTPSARGSVAPPVGDDGEEQQPRSTDTSQTQHSA